MTLWRVLPGLAMALFGCRLAGQGSIGGGGLDGGGPIDVKTGGDRGAPGGGGGPATDARFDGGGVVDRTGGGPDEASEAPHACAVVGGVATWTRGQVRVSYDLTAGTATFFHAGAPRITRFHAGVQLPALITTRMYSQRDCVEQGPEATVTSTGPGLPTLRQTFTLSDGDQLLLRLTVESPAGGAPLSTRWIAPLLVDDGGSVDLGPGASVRALHVPFDNDHWVSYTTAPIASGTSFEVGAFYDEATRAALVVGSVDHALWKTGLSYRGSGGTLSELQVWGGATDATQTHDVVPHGAVTGMTVASPTLFVASGPDWRDLLQRYADANATVQPPLRAPGGVRFGWNSWGKVQGQLSHAKAIAVSDFVKAQLQGDGFAADDAVTINLDSYWDNLSDSELRDFVAHCRANGQKAGVYWAPFVDWGKAAGRAVEGAPGVNYSQLWLRDRQGDPIELDGAYAIDPTHPATRRRIDTFIDRFKDHGFSFIKLDFLSHGALESSVRADASVPTGIAAYNQGMRYLVDRVGGSMFISAAISPLFPHQYAHARRISCDTYGAAAGDMSAAYQLNSVSYGFWLSGRLYAFNDPDHMVFEGFSAADNMTRLLSAVISGTVFLNGDDLSRTPGQELARTYLTNPRINAVARLGQTFRPVDASSGASPATLFVLHAGGAHYLAAFNFGDAAATLSIDLARAGLASGRDYQVTDLWTGAVSSARGSLPVTLDGRFAKLFALQ